MIYIIYNYNDIRWCALDDLPLGTAQSIEHFLNHIPLDEDHFVQTEGARGVTEDNLNTLAQKLLHAEGEDVELRRKRLNPNPNPVNNSSGGGSSSSSGGGGSSSSKSIKTMKGKR